MSRFLTCRPYEFTLRGPTATLIGPGDLVLHRFADPGKIGWLIERAQFRMLDDLGGIDLCTRLCKSRYTHASTIGDPGECLEMTNPRARAIAWGDYLQPGDSLLVRRPVTGGPWSRDIPTDDGEAIADAARADARAGTPYPLRELLVYYGWSWGIQKLLLGRKLAKIFDSRRSDVCSGRYWQWCLDAGIWDAAEMTPEERATTTHYPAELAISKRFRTVCEVRAVAG